jgi:CheY-like chemotaxis protein
MSDAKVLVVDANQDSRAALAHALTEAGYEAAVATSGSFALTMLEWEQPDLIVSYAKVQDMDGYELFTMVRRDPATKDTPFLLLAGRDRPIALAATEAGVDMTVTGDFTLDTVMSRIMELLGDAPSAAPARRAAPVATPAKGPAKMPARTPAAPPVAAPPAKTGAEPARSSFQGSLGVMDLTELTQVISLGVKTGELLLSLSGGEGSILFEAGRVVHAEFSGKAGEAAFAAMVVASQREGEARFCFNRAERDALAGRPRTISRSVEQLLLSVAQEIDEATPGAAGRREAAASRGTRRDG